MIGEVILKNKLFSGESINIEYKVEMPKKSEKYMKTVVAFANGRGGRIVFGVDDKTLNIGTFFNSSLILTAVKF